MNSCTSFVCALACLFNLLIAFQCQSQSENRTIVKEWLTANKDKVTLISNAALQKMSPDVRTLLQNDHKTLVYTQTVTVEDIQQFEKKSKVNVSIDKVTEHNKKPETTNKSASLQPLKANLNEQTLSYGDAKDAQKVKDWLDLHAEEIQVISQPEFNALPLSKRNKNMLVYKGNAVSLQDIKDFKSKN